jgi:preprotein translocase subunit SecG
MVYYLIVTLHVIVCIILILVVLLQSGKGADLAGAFGGGGSQTAFGSRGPASFLSKITTAAAIVFMVTSIALSGMGRKTTGSSVMEGTATKPAPVTQAPAPQTQTPAPSLEDIKKIQQEVEAKQGQATKQAAPPATAQPAEKTGPAKTAPLPPQKPK